MIQVKRVYEKATPRDGRRILVDRIWPRGVSKSDAHIDSWLKDVSPSTELRKWFGHDPRKWAGFKKRYFAELDEGTPGLEELVDRAAAEAVTLVFSARDTRHNQAVALKEYLESIVGARSEKESSMTTEKKSE